MLKDPLAVLSAAWLAERFDAAVVVLIRHPLAFVGSVKRLGWGSPVAGLLAQPLLIRDYLQPLLREAQRYTAHDTDRVDQAAMLWKIIYTVVDCYRDRHPSWYFVRHEDLSTNPIAEFARLYTQLNLQFDAAIARTIDDYTGSHNPPDTPERNTVVRVDSRANLNTWQRRLSRDEVARVRHITASVAERFYGSDEW